jgi:Protein of unknown function (DUF4236)
MGYLRFHRRIRIIPGFAWLNFSKSGVSLTIGFPGCHLTIGRQCSLCLGLEGTGLSYRWIFHSHGARS